MRFKQIMEMSTVAGGIAPVSAPLGATQTRENASVKGLKPVTQLKSKSKNKGPYANSVNEGKVKDLSMDLKSPPNGLSDADFLAKYKKSKADMRASLKSGTASKVNEAELSEADLIVVPGQGKRLKPGFISRAADRTDREVEMAKGDLFQAAKNAKAVFDMVKDISEDDGLEGWVQEKIVKAADYLNTLREYFESKQVQETALPGGVIAGGMAGESRVFRSAGGVGGNALEDMEEAKRPERQAPSTSLQVGNRVVADLRKEKNYPGTSQYRSGIVSRVGEKGVHIKPDDGGEAEWHPYKIVKKLGSQGVGEGAKVDRMVKHVAQSEKKLGHSAKEAEKIAWATANKRGMLDNKNKKK